APRSRDDRSRHRRADRARRPLSAPALGRPGAARRDRARRGHRPDAAARRRADRRSRCEVGRRGVDAAAAAEPRIQEDDRQGDARPARGRAGVARPASRKRHAVPTAGRSGGDAMKFVGLVVKSVRRNKRRTALTVLSVALAVFLFSSLRAVLDGFAAVSAASSATRVVTVRSTSMIFSMPTSHLQTIRSTPGVEDVAWANWFGGIYK